MVRLLIIMENIQYAYVCIISFEWRFLEFQHFEFDIPLKHPVAAMQQAAVALNINAEIEAREKRAPWALVLCPYSHDILERGDRTFLTVHN